MSTVHKCMSRLSFATEIETAVILRRGGRALLARHGNRPAPGGRVLDTRHCPVATTRETLRRPVPELAHVVTGTVTKGCRTGLRRLNGRPAPLTPAFRGDLRDGTLPPPGHDAGLCDTRSGCLYRCRRTDLETIADFGPPVFVAVVAPCATSARSDNTGGDRHRLNGDRP